MTLTNRSPSGKSSMDLPGVHRPWWTNASGDYVWRWYAWRGKGAPKIWEWTGPTKDAGRAAAIAAAAEIAVKYAVAHAPRSSQADTRTVAGVLDAWEASDEFRAVSDSTKAERRRLLKDIRESVIGKLPTKLLAAHGAPKTIKAWRAQEANKRGNRAADYRVQVLSAALNWGRGEGLVLANPTAMLKPLHFSDRSEIIWTASDLENHAKAARKAGDPDDYLPPETLALMGACYSGLSRQDLVALTWSQVKAHALTGSRLKAARHARTVGKKPKPLVIPRTPELNAVLAICSARAIEWEKKDGAKRLHVFLNSRGKPWTPDGLTTQVNKARNVGGPPDQQGRPTPIVDANGRPKHLHDARGTFITTMKADMPNLTNADLAKMTGWSEDGVERIVDLYVDHDRVALAWLDRLKRHSATD